MTTTVKSPTTRIDVHLDVHHLTRVEGHGNIVVDVRNGIIEQCDLQIVEAPRFMEAMLRGRPYTQAPLLASRICGICAVAHTTASLRAVEQALDIVPSPQTTLLRLLNFCGEILDSHILHTYMLVAPDLLGLGSVLPLAAEQPEVVTRALRMKKVAGDLCAAVGGRHTHPVAMTVGGFTHFPAAAELEVLGERLEAMRADMTDTVALFKELALPTFARETEYLALRPAEGYGFMGDTIASSDGGMWPVTQYRQVTNEFHVSHSTAKRARHRRESYMVGALARFNLNDDRLHPQAQAAAQTLRLAPGCHNSFLITLAQVVEMVHCVETAVSLIQQLLTEGIKPEPPVKPGRLSGAGVGAVEAPRGTLYHDYEIKGGTIAEANCVIPTAQNLANIEADMRALLPHVLDRPPDDIKLALEMLVRAYDPCISCATHTLQVAFVE